MRRVIFILVTLVSGISASCLYKRPHANCECTDERNNWQYKERFDSKCVKENYETTSTWANITWIKAHNKCRKIYHAKLLMPKSERELSQAYVSDWVGRNVYIGLWRDKKTKQWSWDDGEPLTWAKWGDGEPVRRNKFDCAVMYVGRRNEAVWKAVRCRDRKGETLTHLVCEMRSNCYPNRCLKNPANRGDDDDDDEWSLSPPGSVTALPAVSKDGYMAPWGEWGGCSTTCGPGAQTRSRTCIEPKFYGKDCEGPLTNTRYCPFFYQCREPCHGDLDEIDLPHTSTVSFVTTCPLAIRKYGPALFCSKSISSEYLRQACCASFSEICEIDLNA